jgi:hypothetical protein
MAQVDSDLYTEQNEKFKRSTGNTNHDKRVHYKIPLTAPSGTAIVAADTLALFDLPIGSVVRPELSVLVADAATQLTGSSITVILGDAADDNRYMVSDVLTTFQVGPLTDAGKPAALFTPYEVEEANKTLTLTLSAITGTWAAGESAGHIELVVDLP